MDAITTTVKRSTAIVVLNTEPKEFKKYHNINPDKTKRFFNFIMNKFEKAIYVNFYDKETKKFLKRETLRQY